MHVKKETSFCVLHWGESEIFLDATRLEPFEKPLEKILAGQQLELPCKAEHDENLEVKYEWLVNGKVKLTFVILI